MRGRLSTIVPAVLLAAAVTQPAAAANGNEKIDYHDWTSAGDFARGTLEGLRAEAGGVRVAAPVGTVERAGRSYEYGRWTSPVHEQGFDATELIASWHAATPEHTWLQVEARARTASGEETAWYVLGRWAHGDADIRRTSVGGQQDAHARVSVDTLMARPGVLLRSYQLRVSLYREAGGSATPVLRGAGAMTSRVPDRFDVPGSEPGPARGVELDVPRYAQNIHKGRYPEYGGGGENWCSPASTAMVLAHWDAGPGEAELSWLPADYPDREVAHAARHTYDVAYQGTGNWSFNTAYAAHHGLRAHVTRLHSLAELEGYVVRGIPVITSQSFLESELDGAGYGTAGHLLVVVGFTGTGDVIVNDPAAESGAGVRKVYPRAQFETIWQRTKRHDARGAVASGPGGIVYLITR
ncbi:C39 family peptidase [Qaidamihabitans albus]|uniref:C39 family peptidase n=1 Tax=Qaidamihabitans albus TaxID=2795733 RepID=UPI0018F12300|nr:C39 family peptidase [Qaidamihabitans albus]